MKDDAPWQLLGWTGTSDISSCFGIAGSVGDVVIADLPILLALASDYSLLLESSVLLWSRFVFRELRLPSGFRPNRNPGKNPGEPEHTCRSRKRETPCRFPEHVHPL